MIPSLDIIIINWNSDRQLRDCLDSIVSSDCRDFKLGKVIVVDNASTDSSLDCLDDINLPLTIIKNIENKGFGAACNQGAAISKSEYFLFLNPDTRLFNDALDKAVSFMENSLDLRVGVVGIQLVDELGKVQRNCTRFPSITNLWCSILGVDKLVTNKFTSYFMKEWDHNTTQKVDQVMGAFYLIRSKLFQLLGGFDERFFVYFEDLDLSYRLNKLGWSSYYLAEVQSFHKGGGTSNKVKSTRLFYFVRSRILYTYKHFHFIPATTILFASLAIEPVTRVAFSMTKFSFSQIRETIVGYVQLFTNFPTTYNLIRTSNFKDK